MFQFLNCESLASTESFMAKGFTHHASRYRGSQALCVGGRDWNTRSTFNIKQIHLLLAAVLLFLDSASSPSRTRTLSRYLVRIRSFYANEAPQICFWYFPEKQDIFFFRFPEIESAFS